MRSWAHFWVPYVSSLSHSLDGSPVCANAKRWSTVEKTRQIKACDYHRSVTWSPWLAQRSINETKTDLHLIQPAYLQMSTRLPVTIRCILSSRRESLWIGQDRSLKVRFPQLVAVWNVWNVFFFFLLARCRYRFVLCVVSLTYSCGLNLLLFSSLFALHCGASERESTKSLSDKRSAEHVFAFFLLYSSRCSWSF